MIIVIFSIIKYHYEYLRGLFSDCDASLNNHCYQLYHDFTTYYEAEDACADLGGSLVAVCNQEINDLLEGIMQQQGMRIFYSYDYFIIKFELQTILSNSLENHNPANKLK